MNMVSFQKPSLVAIITAVGGLVGGVSEIVVSLLMLATAGCVVVTLPLWLEDKLLDFVGWLQWRNRHD